MVVFLNLKSFFSSNKILAVAFSVLMVVCLVGGLFGVNYVYCNVEVYNRYFSQQNTYKIVNHALETQKSLNEFMQKYKECFSLALASYHEVLNGEEAEIFTYIFADESVNKMFAERGRTFTEEEVHSGAKKILLKSSDVSVIGEMVRLGEEEYEVIGLSDKNIIPYYSMRESIKVETIELSTLEPFLGRDRENLREDLQTMFFGMEIEFPEEDTKSFLDFAPMMIPTFILIFLGFVNLSFLYFYFLRMRKRQYAIFRIGGASMYKIFCICLAEIVLLFSSAFCYRLRYIRSSWRFSFPRRSLCSPSLWEKSRYLII